MKFARLVVLAAALLASVGCTQNVCQNGCGGNRGLLGGHSRPAHVGQVPHRYMREIEPAGPPSAAYAYPYYSLRGPRDFLVNNPPSIGP